MQIPGALFLNSVRRGCFAEPGIIWGSVVLKELPTSSDAFVIPTGIETLVKKERGAAAPLSSNRQDRYQ